MSNQDRKVLIIDSDTRDRATIAKFLENEQYQVETGKCLTDAIKKVSTGNYDCLIMDVNLPEMKGYEAVSILKNIDSELKIIMMTRRNSKRLEAKVRGQDVFFYFIKSFGNEELKLAINNAFIK
ncbi:MAG: response regulator [Candidatus Aminicenantes bacterium]|nr:response regulator [Candidatus Aminicenantes bacterium]